MFKLIEGTKCQPPDYEKIYLNGMMKAFNDFDGSQDKNRKLIFYTVKYFPRVNLDLYDREDLENLLAMNDSLLDVLCLITPADLMTIFPIKKTYDGSKYEMKDYFTTMEAVNAHGLNEPFKTADSAQSLLWEYWNRDIMEYQVKVMSIISALNRIETGKGLMEQFIDDQGLDLPICRKYTDQNGRSFILDENGRSSPMVKSSPKYFKLVQ